MLQEQLSQLVKNKSMSFQEACKLTHSLMSPGHHPALVGALLAALKMKGEDANEIAGFASGLKETAVKIPCKQPEIYDVAGTGGDGAHTVNLSTLTGFILAGAGVKVAKHGNRSVSSRCGSADVLHELGVNIHATPVNIAKQLDEGNICFIYAPLAHVSMKNVMESRKALGMPSVFNLAGPLANPLKLKGQMVGVFDSKLLDIMAQCLVLLQVENGIVVHGHGGLDEVSISGPSEARRIQNGVISEITIDPKDYGIPHQPIELLKGGSAVENSKLLLGTLNGVGGAIRDAALINSATALFAFEKVATLSEGIDVAAKSIDSGAALATLNKLIEMSNE